ncbi:hypothetical protein [Chitinophaga qingshengii]|uniref:Uncharacterized protein n=1 Tax=Chitinophaga qingshengii TaxID=1569794 RepID=A0ABR7TR31_9BACT|nr:hypothetical protein [Chitinophaga qingshengii]MBC9932945.1 hypothetical protein [Chitinophaga qingshengii]
MNDIYLHQFKKIWQQTGWEYSGEVTPEAIADHWKSFVQGCEGVYTGSVFDFDQGVLFRSTIEKILTNAEMAIYPEFKAFVEAVYETDTDFRALTREGRVGEFWWERALLRNTGALYKEQIQLYYGISFPEE